MNLSDAEYKKFIEARVSNQKGTTLTEVIVVTLGGVAASALSSRVYHLLSHQGAVARACEFVCLTASLLLLATSESPQHSAIFAAVLALPLVVSLLLARGTSTSATATSAVDAGLSLLKGSLMMQTVVAILAVDFAPFPGRFMKTETFGISLMDVGVGAFVFTSALSRAAGQARRHLVASGAAAAAADQTATKSKSKSKKSSSRKSTAARSSPSSPHPSRSMSRTTGGASLSSFVHAALAALKRSQLSSCIPLLLLGFARLAAVKGSDYQEHVSEYGVHWNFFFTLGALPIVVAVAHGLVSTAMGGEQHTSLALVGTLDLAAGGLLLVVHQVLLTGPLGLTDYVLSPHRRTLIEANKEGLVSSLGYGALYLLSSALYALLLAPSSSAAVPATNKKKNKAQQSAGASGRALRAALLGAVLVGVSFVLEQSVQAVSRRLCNSTYVVMCIGAGFVAYAMCSLAASSFAVAAGRSADALTCVTENQLFLFLVANIGTGIVNNTMRTVFAPATTAYSVLTVYVMTVLFVATQLSAAGVRIKF